MTEEVADLSAIYILPVARQYVYTHYENYSQQYFACKTVSAHYRFSRKWENPFQKGSYPIASEGNR